MINEIPTERGTGARLIGSWCRCPWNCALLRHKIALACGEKLCKMKHFARSNPRMNLRRRRGNKTDQNLMETRFIVVTGAASHAGTI